MEFKPKNREWVKNAAIIFLLILLVLTFFSNTIMNRTLPEVATQSVQSGPITAKVRGTGTVAANGTHQVKADKTREIRAVMVKAGQEVQAGDVLFVLGAGDSAELEAAQSALRQLQTSYQKAAISVQETDYTLDEKKIQRAEQAVDQAQEDLDRAIAMDSGSGPVGQELIKQAKDAMDKAKADLDAAKNEAYEAERAAQDEVDKAWEAYQDALENPDPVTASADYPNTLTDGGSTPPPTENEPANVKATREAYEAAKLRLAEVQNNNATNIKLYQDNYDRAKEKYEGLLAMNGGESEAVRNARKALEEAEDNLLALEMALEEKIAADEKATQMSQIDLADLAAQMEIQRQKIKELSGGEENEITANVSGTIQTVDCTAGDTKVKDDVLCTIEVPDMGYTLSFSVTNDQAKRLRPGDSGTVSNYYWGNQITAKLSTIKVDPKNPQTNKLLTFDLEGDVNAGAELTLSVGSKSANYDTIVPNSAIRNDTNGNFVLKIEAKNSPLGNRYIARRVAVEVLAADDINSAVTGDLEWSDYVITTSNAPIKSGDQVRMADS